MNIMKYLFRLKLINTCERVGPSQNCEKTAPTCATANKQKAVLDEIPTAIRSFTEKSKQTIANRLNLDLLCVFSALLNSATGTRVPI